MSRPSLVTALSAALVALIGVFFVLGVRNLEFGTARMMGPGYFPVTLGAILLCLAVAILITGSLRREEITERFAIRPFIAVLASVLVFTLTVEPAGLVPAVAIATLVASTASPMAKLRTAIATSVVTAGLCWLIFIVGLGVPVRPFGG